MYTLYCITHTRTRAPPPPRLSPEPHVRKRDPDLRIRRGVHIMLEFCGKRFFVWDFFFASIIPLIIIVLATGMPF